MTSLNPLLGCTQLLWPDGVIVVQFSVQQGEAFVCAHCLRDQSREREPASGQAASPRAAKVL